MPLDYLLFDMTDEEDGACGFDALASVSADRLAALLYEIEAVLGWAFREFGEPVTTGDQGEWDFELQATGEPDTPLEISYDAERARVVMPKEPAGRVTIAVTLSGSLAFGDAFRQAFPDPN